MEDRVRIDKWLWHARFYRTRVMAQSAASAGSIRINGQRVERASLYVGTGDILTLPQGNRVVVVRVLGVAKRRSSAPEARRLYEILPENSLDREGRAS
ncbi:MAG TPA: RNA-binding S4 domain-containing protein [Rhizomicrobium sp.]|nr:RNA-binding S4 domain-containing protein [Rhizomicrobium sp.]